MAVDQAAAVQGVVGNQAHQVHQPLRVTKPQPQVTTLHRAPIAVVVAIAVAVTPAVEGVVAEAEAATNT